jgi:polar amino acid transport system substrate-binding protein
MKNILRMFVLVAILIFSANALAETITMGYFNIRPHMYSEGFTAKGAAIDCFETHAEQMGIHVKWVGPLPFPRLIRDLEEGKLDGSLMLSHRAERESFLYFSDKCLTRIYSVLLIRKETPMHEILTADDIAGQRIGYMKGATLSPWMQRHRNRITLDWNHNTDWVHQNIQKVLKGQLFAAYETNHLTMEYTVRVMGINDRVKILRLPEKPMPVYVVFAKKAPRGSNLLKRYNKSSRVDTKPFEDFVQREINDIKVQ